MCLWESDWCIISLCIVPLFLHLIGSYCSPVVSYICFPSKLRRTFKPSDSLEMSVWVCVCTWWCLCVRSWQPGGVGTSRWGRWCLPFWVPAKQRTCYWTATTGPPTHGHNTSEHFCRLFSGAAVSEQWLKVLTPTLPNSQARSRGVFPALSTIHGLDWCCSNISDCRKEIHISKHTTHEEK